MPPSARPDPVRTVCPAVAIPLLASWVSSPAAPRSAGRCFPSSPAPVLQAIVPALVPRCARPSRHPPLLPRHCGARHARRLAVCRLATPCRSVNRTESLEIPSLSHVAPSGVSERFPELLGFRQSPCPCLLVSPSRTEAPSLHRRYPVSPVLRASPPPRRPKLVLADSRLAQCTPPTGLPVLRFFPSSTRAAATTPAEPVGAPVARFPTAASLPRYSGGSASALPVSRPARRSLALRPAWSLNRPRRPFIVEVLQSMSLPPSSAPTATGWSDSCRTGFAPVEE